jgi:hypothetical protein
MITLADLNASYFRIYSRARDKLKQECFLARFGRDMTKTERNRFIHQDILAIQRRQ